MIEITNVEQFTEETKEGVVLVDVFAPWCGLAQKSYSKRGVALSS